MKSRIKFVSTCVLSLFLIACNSDRLREREIALKERELELRKRELELESKNAELPTPDSLISKPISQEPQRTTKYMYVVITTDEPMIGYNNAQEIIDGKPAHAISKYFTYASDVITIDEYTEDRRFMEIDNYERKLRRYLSSVNQRLEEKRSRTGVKARAKVVSRNSYVFDSYSEASSHRANETGSNQETKK